VKVATFTLIGSSPYSQSRPYQSPRGEKEGHDEYEKRVWQEHLHVLSNGQIFIPPMVLKNGLRETAEYLVMPIEGKGKQTYTKHFKAGLLLKDQIPLYRQDANHKPIMRDDIEGEWLFMHSNPAQRKGRVLRCYPKIDDWQGQVTVYVLDETITQKIFETHLRQAGEFIGIGRFRPRNGGFYGRFTYQDFSWADYES
jgi:hypothetical protein